MGMIGRYEVRGRLGRGGMSTVYKARAPITGRLVALKILQPRDEIFVELAGAERLAEMFIEEARIMGGINHPHVAKVLDCDQHEGQPFIVLEYFPHSLGGLIGESYRVEEPSRLISMGRTRSYLIQALRGLDRLHFAGVVHRDVKPYNLMITQDDRIKLIDFGLSRVRGEERTTIPGMQVGSPCYAAPEQIRTPAQADARADLFSLGVLGCRMLTGHLPEFTADGQVLLPEHLEGRWQEFLTISLARDPEQRYQNAQDMQLAAERLPVLPDNGQQDESGGALLASDYAPQPRRQPGRVRWTEIGSQLALDGLFRPRQYARQDFQVQSSHLLRERVSGLIWQRRGAGFELNWHQAHHYIDQLNQTRYQGLTGWRLPTVEELALVLSPPIHGRPHSAWPLFEGDIHWLWSGDYITRKQAWMADVVESYFDRLDMEGYASVCAVCEGEEEV